MLYLCTVSAINSDGTTADIAIGEREDMVVTEVPFLNIEKENLPGVNDTVVAIFEERDGRLGRGFILGRPSNSGGM